MKKLLLVLLILFAMGSCLRNNKEPQLDISPKLNYISKMEFFGFHDNNKLGEYLFTYDNQMRLVSFVKSSMNYISEGRIIYFGNTIRIEYGTYKDPKQRTKSSMIFQLTENNQRKIVLYERSYYGDDGREEHYRDTDFRYDALGRCIAYVGDIDNKVVNLEWNNGNLIKGTYTYSPSSSSSDIEESHDFIYTTIPNNIYPDLNNFLYFQRFTSWGESLWSDQFGIKSTKLLQSIKTSYSDDIGVKEEISCKYEKFDAKGRPIEITMRNVDISRAINKVVITYLDK